MHFTFLVQFYHWCETLYWLVSDNSAAFCAILCSVYSPIFWNYSRFCCGLPKIEPVGLLRFTRAGSTALTITQPSAS